MKRFALPIVGLVAAGAALAAPPASAAEVKLKAVTFLPSRASFTKPFIRYVGEVNKRCKGKVSITTVGPAAIKSFEQWSALKTGVVDMLYGPPNYYKGTMVEGDVLILAHNQAADQRKNGAWAMINAVHNKKMNAWYLTHFGDGIKFYLYTKKPAKNGRFDGMRVRSTNIYDAFFRHLGAVPMRMPPSGVYTGLERGTVDGFGWPLWGVADFGWHKYVKYRYGPGFFNVVVNILVNLDKWKSLSADQQKCLTDVAIWSEKQWPAWLAAQDKKEIATQTKAGIKYVDMGPSFPAWPENRYWNELAKESPAFIKKIRPLLMK
jgi:TRAP-type C4-dicarboxylate transport system substrate-binding protein